MLENIEILCHASIKFNGEKIIYFDPFKIEKEYHDADIIFITHSHYDHFSEEDIQKVKKLDTKIVVTKDLYDRTKELGFKEEILETKNLPFSLKPKILTYGVIFLERTISCFVIFKRTYNKIRWILV